MSGKRSRDLREAGFENISFDLIAGLPAQTLSAGRVIWTRRSSFVQSICRFYLLEVHEGTPLAEQIGRGAAARPDDDLAAEMYRDDA